MIATTIPGDGGKNALAVGRIMLNRVTKYGG
jgi:hypothetical protein